jgi:hypothetical protein
VFRDARYAIAFLKNDEAGMLKQVTLPPNSASSRDLLAALADKKRDAGMLAMHANTEAFRGRFRTARLLAESAVRSAANVGHSTLVTEYKLEEAQRELEVGNVQTARLRATEALRTGYEDYSPFYLSTLALSGEVAHTKKLALKVKRENTLDTIIQKQTLPMIEATIALEEKRPRASIDILKNIAPYDLAGRLYPAYLRGQAYLELEQGQQAAQEFQNIIDHPGVVLNNIIGILARLKLGRAQAMMGDKEAARKSYDDFLTLWKDADPDIPIYQQAKAEYAKLR